MTGRADAAATSRPSSRAIPSTSYLPGRFSGSSVTYSVFAASVSAADDWLRNWVSTSSDSYRATNGPCAGPPPARPMYTAAAASGIWARAAVKSPKA